MVVADVRHVAGADIRARSMWESVLSAAAEDGNAYIVNRYLEEAERSGLDRRELTDALLAACKIGQAEIARTLIAAGANAKYRDRRSGKSILMYAARSGSVETVQVLI